MDRGRLVARVLAGSWRPTPPPVDGLTADELSGILPLLLASGSGPLAWARIRTEPFLAAGPSGIALHDAFRHSVLDTALREQRLVDAVVRLRTAGIEPMLIKGRAAAAAYAEPARRPAGDLDLLVRPGEMERAAVILAEGIRLLAVDLNHTHLVPPDEREAMFRRASQLRLPDLTVTVPSPEDHLRLLCLHALCHGVVRPVWLCDAAAWAESRTPAFDWEVALAGGERTRERVTVMLRLAHSLLGLEMPGTPVDVTVPPPAWVSASVARRWGDLRRAIPVPAWADSRGVAGRTRAIADRWPPDPIEEAFRHGRPFSRWPRLPFHVVDAARRIVRHPARQVHGEASIPSHP